jgi:hypothetical protein
LLLFDPDGRLYDWGPVALNSDGDQGVQVPVNGVGAADLLLENSSAHLNREEYDYRAELIPPPEAGSRGR